LPTDTEEAHRHFTVNTDTLTNQTAGATITATQSPAFQWNHVSDGTVLWGAHGSGTNPSLGLTSDISTTPSPPASGRAAHNNLPPYATGIWYVVAGYMINGSVQGN
jgi:hypothetical protein